MRRHAVRRSAVVFLGLVVACGRAPEGARRAAAGASTRSSDSPAHLTAPDSTPRPAVASPGDRSFVRPGEIPAALRATCDSASAIIREALALAAHREEGSYFDSAREVPRVGCRLVARGSFKALGGPGDPVAALEASFRRHRWRPDLRHGADGPDGSTAGMRFREALCIVVGRWKGGDDDDPDASGARADGDQSYEAVVECARDVASNADAGVPDSMWRVAHAAGLDSLYAISLSVQYPPYLSGDFDGDGVMDAAVLIEHRFTGKMGVAVLHRGTQHVSILGAGTASAGPDDLEWMDAWEVFPRGATMHLTIGDRPTTPLVADALWVGRRDSVSAFFVWTGRRFVYEAHAR